MEEKVLQKLLDDVKKTYGSNTLIKLGDQKSEPLPAVSTGILEIDKVFGCGGLPRGRIIEIFGTEGTGKSLLTLLFVAGIQKQGGRCVFIDAEQSFDTKWAEFLGVNIKDLYLMHPDTAEATFDVLEKLVGSGVFDLIIIDSAAALMLESELEESYNKESRIGATAKFMSRGLKRLNYLLGKEKRTVVIFINQVRYKIGILFGDPTVTPGGMALKFYSSLRLKVSKIMDSDIKIKSSGRVIGHKVNLKVIKNKCGPVFTETNLVIKYASEEERQEQKITKEGSPEPILGTAEISEALDNTEIVKKALEKGIIQKSGKLMYSFNEKRYFKRKFLEDEILMLELKNKLNESK